MRHFLILLALFPLLWTAALAKDKEKDGSKDQGESGIVMFWPNQDNAILKLTFSRFQNMGSYGGQMTLVSNVVVQNLSTKLIPRASFSVALLDKDRVRIGNGSLVIDDLNAGESAKVQFQCVGRSAYGAVNFRAQQRRRARFAEDHSHDCDLRARGSKS